MRPGIAERETFFSTSRRMTKSFRSKLIASGQFAPRPTKICRITGCELRAVGPSVALSVGTSRQPSSVCPSSRTTSSKILEQAARPASFGGRKTMPAAQWPGFCGRAKPSLSASARRNACGVCSRMPAPSPVFFSAPTAPRCSRFTSTVSAFATMSCEGRPFTSATKPKPHASCSCWGS